MHATTGLSERLRNMSDDPSRGSCRQRDKIGGDDNHRVDPVIVKDDLKRLSRADAIPSAVRSTGFARLLRRA